MNNIQKIVCIITACLVPQAVWCMISRNDLIQVDTQLTALNNKVMSLQEEFEKRWKELYAKYLPWKDKDDQVPEALLRDIAQLYNNVPYDDMKNSWSVVLVKDIQEKLSEYVGLYVNVFMDCTEGEVDLTIVKDIESSPEISQELKNRLFSMMFKCHSDLQQWVNLMCTWYARSYKHTKVKIKPEHFSKIYWRIRDKINESKDEKLKIQLNKNLQCIPAEVVES